MAGFVLLHARRLLDHPGRLAMAVIGVAAGTSLIVAMFAVYTSITGSVRELTELAGNADLEISPVTDAGLDASILDQVRAIDGIDRAAPLVRTWIAIDGDVALLIAGDADTAELIGSEENASGSRLLEGLDGVVTTARVADAVGAGAGEQVSVYSNTGGPVTTTLVATTADPTLSRVNGGRIVLTGLDHARELLGRGDRIDTVLVAAEPGSSVDAIARDLRTALGAGVLVEDRATRNERIAAPAVTYLSQLGPIAAMALVVGGFLVFNTMNMAALERRRELATLRTLGASRRRLLAGILGEAAVLGAAGAAIGAAAGVGLARVVVAQLPVAMEQAIGTEVAVHVPLSSLAGAFVLGVATSVVAALVPALHATQPHPLDALRPTGTLAGGGSPSAVSRRPLLVGCGLIVTGLVVVATVRGDRATAGILLLTFGAVLASYGLAPLTANLAARVSRLGGGLGHIAATGLQRAPQRVWATTMAVALAVTMTVATAAGAQNQLDLDAEHLAGLRDTDFYVAAHPLDQLAVDVQLPEDLAGRIAAIDGVANVSTLTSQQAVLEGKTFLLFGADASPGRSAFPALNLAPPGARRATLEGDTVILSHQFAREFGLDEGDTAEIPGPNGTLRLPVAAIVTTLSVSDNGMVVLADHVLRQVFGAQGVSSIDVQLHQGADPEQVRSQLATLAASADHPMIVSTGEQGYQAILGGITAVIGLMYGILAITAGVAAIAVLNTLFASVVDRRRELGVLRAVGTTPRQLARIISLEAAGIGVLGATTGLALGSLVHWAGILLVGEASPLPVEYAFVPEVLVVAALAGVAATVAGALIPVRHATRMNVLDAIAWE